MSIVRRVMENGISVIENLVSKPVGLPVVFVHGMWGNASMFHFWLASCEQLNIKGYSIELRGHGKSKNCRDLGCQSIWGYAKDISEVINEIGPCILVGWSMGGLICQVVAEKNSHVKRLVLVASAPPAGIFIRGKVICRMLNLKYILPIIFSKTFRLTDKDAGDFLFNFGFSDKEKNELIKELGPESGQATREIVLCQIPVGPIRCHVTVIGAEHDSITPVSIQRKIAKKYSAKYIEIEGACHSVMLQKNIRDWVFDKVVR